MVKVITYGTYDLFHYGHRLLLERAKALGDYLVVGVTADSFDKSRGKINVQQSLMERIESVRQTGLADEIIVEEYEGQKIDDIRRLGIDIFTVGSDWVGKFDYLNEFCKVVYLPRTEGVSSTKLRSDAKQIRMGFAGEQEYNNKFFNECKFINGLIPSGYFTESDKYFNDSFKQIKKYDSYRDLLDNVDAVFISSKPEYHYDQIVQALENSKHVLCESPIAISEKQCAELFELAEKKGCILMESIKTAYSTAFHRLVLLAKADNIGKIVSIDATCTSLMDQQRKMNLQDEWQSIAAWGPTAMLPVFQILGTDYRTKTVVTSKLGKNFDAFSQINFIYSDSTATVRVGKGIKSEGNLIISGTQGYIYVPAPWWKTDYFEIRYENPSDNERFFFQLEGEGIRQELATFVQSVCSGHDLSNIATDISLVNSRIIEDFNSGKDVCEIDAIAAI